jgi:hypothetical protein
VRYAFEFFECLYLVRVINYVGLKVATKEVATFILVMVKSCNTYQIQLDALSC